jgi:hypothetical protein
MYGHTHGGTSQASEGVESRDGLEISKRLEVISHRGDSAAEFAARIANEGALEYS